MCRFDYIKFDEYNIEPYREWTLNISKHKMNFRNSLEDLSNQMLK